MTTKTELEKAKEWLKNLSLDELDSVVWLSTSKLSPYALSNLEEVLIFREQVIQPFIVQRADFIEDLSIDYELAFELYQKEVLKNTAYFENPVSHIYSDSEVMDKQPQTSQPDLIGKLKEAKEVIEALNSAIDLYWNNYNKPFPESEVIFAQRQCLKFLESLTTLADKQDLK